MQFLADESCDFRVVVALRRSGHGVEAILETAPGAADRMVLEMSRRTGMILLTEDRDFGQLVFADRIGAGAGVLFIRCPEGFRPELPRRIVELVEQQGARLSDAFVVWTPRRVRFRPGSRET